MPLESFRTPPRICVTKSTLHTHIIHLQMYMCLCKHIRNSNSVIFLLNRPNEIHCEVDIQFNVTVSSDSFVSVTPNIAYKNTDKEISDNKLRRSKSNKTKKCKRRHSDPGPKRTRYESI